MLDRQAARPIANHVATERRAGEVVEASTAEFTAEAAELHVVPPFGSLVKVAEPGKPVIYALVVHAATGGLDPTRRAVARSLPPAIIDGQIYVEYPELRDVLRTEFTSLVVGYGDTSGRVWHRLPPYPASLHYSVTRCDDAETLTFSDSLGYLASALAHPEQSIELVAAAIRDAARVRHNDVEYLLRAGRAVAALLAGDYQQLLQILERIAPPEGA